MGYLCGHRHCLPGCSYPPSNLTYYGPACLPATAPPPLRYYGSNPVQREVLESVFSHRPLPSEGEASLLNGVELVQVLGWGVERAQCMEGVLHIWA